MADRRSNSEEEIKYVFQNVIDTQVFATHAAECSRSEKLTGDIQSNSLFNNPSERIKLEPLDHWFRNFEFENDNEMNNVLFDPKDSIQQEIMGIENVPISSPQGSMRFSSSFHDFSNTMQSNRETSDMFENGKSEAEQRTQADISRKPEMPAELRMRQQIGFAIRKCTTKPSL